MGYTYGSRNGWKEWTDFEFDAQPVGIPGVDERYSHLGHMKVRKETRSGLTLVELSITAGLVGVLGLIIFSLLNMGTVLGAKNAAVNTAHQQARVAMIEMLQDLHSSVSLPQLINVSGTQAAGISFQQWGAAPLNGVITPNGGPHRIISDAAAGQKIVHIAVTSGQPAPIVGQRLIVPIYQIEDRIASTSGTTSDLSITLDNNLTTAIKGTASTFWRCHLLHNRSVLL